MNVPWRTLTIVSLAVNLLIIGAAIGFFASRLHEGPRPFAMRMEGRGPEGFRPRLAEPEREALARTLTGAWESGRPLREAARAAREQLSETARIDPYDQQKVREAMAQMRVADAAVLAHYQDALAAGLGALSAEQRVAALRAAGRPGAGGPRQLRMFRERRERGDEPPPPPAP